MFPISSTRGLTKGISFIPPIPLAAVVKHWKTRVVYVSPLTRTLQTACLAFEHEKDTRMVAWPIVTGASSVWRGVRQPAEPFFLKLYLINLSSPFFCPPILAEFYPHMPECQGRNPSELLEIPKLQALERFKVV